MKKLLVRLGWTSLILLVGIQVFRPGRTNPPEAAAETIEAKAPFTPQAGDAFARACADCHSNRTDWPWYSEVAPVSWFVVNHVNHARSHLNVSRWHEYTDSEARSYLDKMCRLARNKEMPLASYRLIHRDAILDDAEIEAICQWSRQAKEALSPPAE
jgi:hypothetical protein